MQCHTSQGCCHRRHCSRWHTRHSTAGCSPAGCSSALNNSATAGHSQRHRRCPQEACTKIHRAKTAAAGAYAGWTQPDMLLCWWHGCTCSIPKSWRRAGNLFGSPCVADCCPASQAQVVLGVLHIVFYQLGNRSTGSVECLLQFSLLNMRKCLLCTLVQAQSQGLIAHAVLLCQIRSHIHLLGPASA